jgi:glycerophosphoryl diester phosphodiesterase
MVIVRLRSVMTMGAAAAALLMACGFAGERTGMTAGLPARAATHCPTISARLGLHWPYTNLPENSAAAIDAAHKAGAPKVEVDVNFSRDGVPMAIHDYWLDGVTAHTGNVWDYTAAQLETFPLKIGGRQANKGMSSQHLISLWSALSRAKADGMRVSVEIKPESLTADRAHAVALRFGWLNDWNMIDVRSFDPPVLAAMRRADHRIHTTLTVNRPVVPAPAGNVMESIEFNASGAAIKPATVSALHAAGLAVDAYTPNTPAEFKTVPLTVDQITTNNVPGALAFLKAHGC